MFVFTDGFDSYAATADLIKKWGNVSGVGSWNATAGRTGGGGFTGTSAALGTLDTPVLWPGGVSSGFMHLGFSLKASAIPSTTFQELQLISTAGTAVALSSLLFVSGKITFNNTNNTIIGTSATNVCDNAWHWIEMKWPLSGSGVIQVYIDSTLEINLSTTWNLSSQVIGGVRFNTGNGVACTVTYDDIVIYDDNSPRPTTSQFPLGPRQITTLRPSADSAVQFARSAGSDNYALVNEVNGDSDTTYVQDGTSGEQDLYDYDNLSFNPTIIDGVMLNSYIKNASAGLMNFKGIAKSGATQTDGSSIVLTDYKTKLQQFGVDPNTSAAWAQSGLNAATFGVKVV